MSVERLPKLSTAMLQAIEELEGLIRQRYPDATFRVTRSPEDAKIVLLRPVVNVENRDEVVDVVIDRLGEMQTEQRLPLFVVPMRTAARNAAIRTAMKQKAASWHLPPAAQA